MSDKEFELCEQAERKKHDDKVRELEEQRILDLQEDKGSLIDKVRELEQENAELILGNKSLSEKLMNTTRKKLDLQKENAKLKTDYEVLSCSVGDFGELQDKLEEEQRKNNGLSDNLTKAKEIINEYINILKGDTKNWKKTQNKAEQFLKDSEVEK